VIVLVDNVRDENYLDRNNARNVPYVAGFYDAELDDALDRNVVSLDAYDWPHRLRASPPHAPVRGNNCTSAPARPFLYEATLAHEYQHLLQDVTDPNEHEDVWVDEGLADFAQTLSGYARPARRIDQLGFDSHVQCILGWLNVSTPFNPQPRRGGPENSLTRWGDQGDAEILCDYGAAYTFVHFLADRYGTTAAGELYREPDIGLVGFSSVLERLGAAEDAFGLMHDWSAMLALDAALDRGTPLRIGDAQRFRSATLSAEINWDNPDTYSEPGAPPNGSDFVRLRDGAGRYLAAAKLQALSFRGTRPTRPGLSYTVQLIGYSTTAPADRRSRRRPRRRRTQGAVRPAHRRRRRDRHVRRPRRVALPHRALHAHRQRRGPARGLGLSLNPRAAARTARRLVRRTSRTRDRRHRR
jgi:hypothetical protein